MNKNIIFGMVLLIIAMFATSGCLIQTGLGEEPGTTPDTSCDGVQSVNVLFEDKDKYEIGTDPNTQMTIYSKNNNGFSKLVVDGATDTTVPTNSNFKALAGNNYGVHNHSYFGELVEFSTVCSDVDIQTKMANAVAPTTWTVLNDDGVTKNTNATDEDVTVSSSYIWEHALRAPSRDCSARYGAIVACEYDNTYVSKLESVNGIKDSAQGIYIAHDLIDKFNGTAVPDQWTTFEWDGTELCDGAKTSFAMKMTTTSATQSNDQANVVCYWLPKNYDLHAQTIELLGPTIYDEDNNNIWGLAMTNVTIYVGETA